MLSQQNLKKQDNSNKLLKLFLEQDIKGFVTEYRFDTDTGRRWKFDVAHPRLKIAVEVEGGIWTRGRHTRPAGFIADMEKYNKATELGWRVFRTTTAITDMNNVADSVYKLIFRLEEGDV